MILRYTDSVQSQYFFSMRTPRDTWWLKFSSSRMRPDEKEALSDALNPFSNKPKPIAVKQVRVPFQKLTNAR